MTANFEMQWYGDSLIKEIQDQSEDALFEGGLLLLEDATRRAPEFTGRLKESGYVSSNKRSTYVYRHGFKKERKPHEDGIVAVGFSAPHSHLVEFGTRKMRARPYLRPALDNFKDKIGERIVSKWAQRFRK